MSYNFMHIASISALPFPLPLYRVTKQLTSAQVLNLVSTPVTLTTVPTGYVAVPRYLHLYKPAGVAYDITSFTGPTIKVNGTALIGGAIAAGVLDTTAATSVLMLGPGNAAALFSGVNIGTTGTGDITITATGSNPTLGNSPLNVLVAYNLIPITFQG
jgi:hypothetical protein